ncbi:MAG TPA: hypothetical protein VFF73_25130 [Planctomycetota bacterium]|nr:hypothetical protein [Planctomycetota bacterium]
MLEEVREHPRARFLEGGSLADLVEDAERIAVLHDEEKIANEGAENTGERRRDRTPPALLISAQRSKPLRDLRALTGQRWL